MMIVTLELLFCTDLRRAMLTLGSMTVEHKPELEKAIADFAEQHATTPPGTWVRSYKGRNWLTQSVNAPPFFEFLHDWRHVRDVPRFLDAHSHHIHPSPGAMPEARTNVWIGYLDDPDSVAVAMALPLTA